MSDKPLTASPIYSDFAGIYDRQERYLQFSAKMAPAIIKALKERDVHPRSVLDLACGVGVAAEFFARLGLRVTGVDRSEEMLTLAGRRGSGLGIDWHLADIRDFVISDVVDLVTCMYDSLNYLSDIGEINKVFANVYRCLRPAGWFAFDIATVYALSKKWVGSSVMDANNIFENHQAAFDRNRKINTKVITVFTSAQESSGRFQEIHEERAFEMSEIETALRDAGFTLRGRYDSYHLTAPEPLSVRILYLAEKTSQPRPEVSYG